MFNLKAKCMNKGAGVAHTWLKWLTELRRVLGLDGPQKLPGEQPGLRETATATAGGGGVGAGLTGGGLTRRHIRWSPRRTAAPSASAALRSALCLPRGCICLRARFLRAGEIWL